MPSIFLTRSSNRSKDFTARLSKISEKITTESLLEFVAIEFEAIPSSDWIFFYSQKGVQYFFATLEKKGLSVAQNVKFGAFGNKTASLLASFVTHVDFVGTADATSTSKALIEVARNQSVIFAKGSNSLDSLRQHVQGHLQYLDLEVYLNRPKTNLDIPYHDILVFTSPLNLITYSQKYDIQTSQTVFVIGSSTANAALQSGIESFRISKTPSLSSLADCVEEYILSN